MKDETKPTKKKPVIKQCIALKKLVNFDKVTVEKGGKFSCSEEAYKHFKARKAV